MRLRLVSLTATTLVLAGCGSDITSGKVIDRYHSEPYTWFMTQCVMVGKNPCGSTILIPIEEPEKWVLTLRDCSDECETGRVDVDRETYERVQIGDHYEGKP